ncbi:hypothetical protein L3X38_040033 [Prunus dulcis]|uniref:Uncharacterized protein n=1 Tax=Prunus dulcis TaxID=3755 RepID=A0AAD4V884_PRUDU|nr:hypothetical protein L3X38_040033 [Prunus dulcis]
MLISLKDVEKLETSKSFAGSMVDREKGAVNGGDQDSTTNLWRKKIFDLPVLPLFLFRFCKMIVVYESVKRRLSHSFQCLPQNASIVCARC